MLEQFTFKVAEGDERNRALQLRREVYMRELGHDGIDEFDSQAFQLIALDVEGQIVSALRVVGPTQRPFDLEQLLDLRAFIDTDRTIGEIARFCVAERHREIRSDHFVQIGMLKLVHTFAIRRGLTDYVTLALPHLRNFYRLAFFEAMGSPLTHPLWGPVHPMRLDLVALARRYSASPQPLCRLLFATDLSNVIV